MFQNMSCQDKVASSYWINYDDVKGREMQHREEVGVDGRVNEMFINVIKMLIL